MCAAVVRVCGYTNTIESVRKQPLEGVKSTLHPAVTVTLPQQHQQGAIEGSSLAAATLQAESECV